MVNGASSRGQTLGCGGYLDGAKNPSEIGLFGFGRRLALTSVAADELIVGGRVAVLAR